MGIQIRTTEQTNIDDCHHKESHGVSQGQAGQRCVCMSHASAHTRAPSGTHHEHGEQVVGVRHGRAPPRPSAARGWECGARRGSGVDSRTIIRPVTVDICTRTDAQRNQKKGKDKKERKEGKKRRREREKARRKSRAGDPPAAALPQPGRNAPATAKTVSLAAGAKVAVQELTVRQQLERGNGRRGTGDRNLDSGAHVARHFPLGRRRDEYVRRRRRRRRQARGCRVQGARQWDACGAASTRAARRSCTTAPASRVGTYGWCYFSGGCLVLLCPCSG